MSTYIKIAIAPDGKTFGIPRCRGCDKRRSDSISEHGGDIKVLMANKEAQSG